MSMCASGKVSRICSKYPLIASRPLIVPAIGVTSSASSATVFPHSSSLPWLNASIDCRAICFASAIPLPPPPFLDGSRMMRFSGGVVQPQPRRFARSLGPVARLAGGAQALEEWRADQHIGGRDVGGQRNVAHVADPEQRLNVRVVGVLVERIDQEDDGVDLPLHDAARDLHIAAMGTRGDALDIEADFVAQQVSGRACRNQVIFRKAIAIEGRKS